MPHIEIRMYEGRTSEQKEEIVTVFTRELSRIIERDERFITVEFQEIPLDENAPANLLKTGSVGNGYES
ncbi:tautomerase family protein [Paenibacillus sp. FSL R5-0636]|uniref:tautomerase family protein n=1 Tax=Paenibacillus TaxID=44249 RepID=UPI00096E0C2F|nr:tautomerase family protein [Paenibacillus odorifer]OMD04431.1 4-oxalocrotonate tautomerase [Paenibacillus odorifer]OMD23768.1 4-oxalocrotonate tautomerase [Paenibacillus odorifer]OME62922.1 4-oxalocrotonate tautomerase [Paenibacillus odorifer]OZQ72968.1 4-oxalocrotonate tautomerase [Paenibacillus odorifer]